MGFQHRGEAQRCLRDLKSRLAEFGLELHPTKTRLIEFGRFAERNRRNRGDRKPETFDFLGFTHYCGKLRNGRFMVKRRSIRTKMRAKCQEVRATLRQMMHSTVATQGRWLRTVVQGWFQYHAVPFNSRCLDAFRTQVIRSWHRTLRRRSQKGRNLNWSKMRHYVQRWIPPRRILHPHPNKRLIVKP